MSEKIRLEVLIVLTFDNFRRGEETRGRRREKGGRGLTVAAFFADFLPPALNALGPSAQGGLPA